MFAGLSFSAVALLAVSQAFLNVVDTDSVSATLADYTNNVLRVESADALEYGWTKQRRFVDRFPANTPYQIVVGSDPEDRRVASAALDLVATSMPRDVRLFVERCHLLAPLQQRVLRRCKPGVTNEADYLKASTHPTAWRARDFSLPDIAAFSRLLSSNSVPVLAVLTSVYEDYTLCPIRRAVPLVDYSDPRPEVSFETPCGIGVVLRANERRRKFRFRARGWPVNDRNVSFAWVARGALGGPALGLYPFQRRWGELDPGKGFCEVELNWDAVGGRQDLLVFARYGKGPYGPPSVISFCTVPNEKRVYDRQGRVESLSWRHVDDILPQLYQNKDWTDAFTVDSLGNVIGFLRKRTGMVRGERFSMRGECVLETHPNDLPKVAAKVRYFTRPDDPKTLDYVVTEEEVRYPLATFETDNRGEFPVAVPHDRRQKLR